MRSKAGMKFDCIFEEILDFIDIDYTHLNKTIRYEQRPHGEWIPCSERLPEEDKAVLVYVRRKDIKKSAMNGFYIATKHRMEGDPEGNLNYWGIPVAPCEWRIHGWSYFFEPDVVAWMPLPEPYKKEGE